MSEIPSGRDSIFIAAPPGRVYDFITDVSKLSRLSPECIRAEWNAGQSLRVGATFHGWNQAGDHSWDVDCEVSAVEQHKEFAFRAATDLLGEHATLWRFVLEPKDGGTQVTESYEAPILALPDHPVAQIPGRAEALTEGIRATLQRLKAAIEGS
jgi:uncharacterized protein YndB with AHSA1/START domain